MFAGVETGARDRLGLVRRFCGCDFVRACSCGQPRPRSGWTIEALTRLRAEMREHADVGVAARAVDRGVRDANIALNALMGRSPTHALAALEAAAEARAAR